MFYIFVIIKKSPEKPKIYLLTSIVCVSQPDISLSHKNYYNSSMRRTAALADMFLHHHEHTHCSLFWHRPAAPNTH